MGERQREGVGEMIPSGANPQTFVVVPVRNHLTGEEKNGGRRPDTGLIVPFLDILNLSS